MSTMRDSLNVPNAATDPLAGPLRAAAIAESPAFSPAIHAAVMRRVHRDEPVVGRRSVGRRSGVDRWMMVAAAIAAAATVAVSARMADPPEGGELPGLPSPKVALLPAALPPLIDSLSVAFHPAARHLADARRDYISRNASRLTRFCLDRFDVLPTPVGTIRRPSATGPRST